MLTLIVKTDDQRPQGHNAAARAYAIDLKVCQQNMPSSLVGPEFVEGKEFVPKTYDEVMAEFDKFVGIDEVKKAVSDIARFVEEQRLTKGSNAKIKLDNHFQFLGNPGTGKTSWEPTAIVSAPTPRSSFPPSGPPWTG